VASQPFLEATAGAVGDEQSVAIDGVRRTIQVTSAVRALPAADPDEPAVLMDLPTLSLLRFEGNDAVEPADEWWLAVDDSSRDAVVEALIQPPIGSRAVTSMVERNRALATDPVALGIIGALAIGFVAAALFAVVGFMVSAAVSARADHQFALLRALGLVRQFVWLSLENAAWRWSAWPQRARPGHRLGGAAVHHGHPGRGNALPAGQVEVPWTTIAILGRSLVALAPPWPS
jgi:hypothetical protein